MSRQTNYAESQFLEKHRLEARDYGVEWSAELATGVSLSGNPTITIISSGNDVTSQFGVTSQGTSGTQSVWRLGTAGSGQQDGDATYYLRVEQDTSNNQTLVSVHRLYVSELADTSAP